MTALIESPATDRFAAVLGPGRGVARTDVYRDELAGREWTLAELRNIAAAMKRYIDVWEAAKRISDYERDIPTRLHTRSADDEREADRKLINRVCSKYATANESIAWTLATAFDSEDERYDVSLQRAADLDGPPERWYEPYWHEWFAEVLALLEGAAVALKTPDLPPVREAMENCGRCENPYTVHYRWQDALSPGVTESEAQPFLEERELGGLCETCVTKLREALPGRMSAGRCAWCSEDAEWAPVQPAEDVYSSKALDDEEKHAPVARSARRGEGVMRWSGRRGRPDTASDASSSPGATSAFATAQRIITSGTVSKRRPAADARPVQLDLLAA